jgi:S-adenosylmethionine:tRNA ribosyltransferase-isomerase
LRGRRRIAHPVLRSHAKGPCPERMRVDLFDYQLPPDLIAQQPLRERDRARLLAIGETLGDHHVSDLPSLLRPSDLLIVNDTEVLPTRFWARRERPPSASLPIEVTLVEPANEHCWWGLCRPARRLRPGDPLALGAGLRAEVQSKDAEGRVLLAFEQSGTDLLTSIKAVGAMPLPPYIHRDQGGSAEDRERYQAIFAREPGSVAAPTASLHFSRLLLSEIERRGVLVAHLTLHVGQGTFNPVKAADTADHYMHAESYVIPGETAEAVEHAQREGRRIIAIGTTVLRALESAWCDGRLRPGSGSTRLFITPGYRFRTADLLMTNFHLPRSTLLMLVSAFGGMERVRAAYNHAVGRRYRFFSFGDACLIERADVRTSLAE